TLLRYIRPLKCWVLTHHCCSNAFHMFLVHGPLQRLQASMIFKYGLVLGLLMVSGVVVFGYGKVDIEVNTTLLILWLLPGPLLLTDIYCTANPLDMRPLVKYFIMVT
ncbi:hypothetical protein OTU49_001777, partial [Cherax quadricarinatus]